MLDVRIAGVAKLKKFAEMEFDLRVKAIIHLATRHDVEAIKEDIVSRIPTNEKWMKIYKDSLQIYEMTGIPKDEVGFVIASKVTGDWSMVDAETMVIRFKPTLISPNKL